VDGLGGVGGRFTCPHGLALRGKTWPASGASRSTSTVSSTLLLQEPQTVGSRPSRSPAGPARGPCSIGRLQHTFQKGKKQIEEEKKKIAEKRGMEEEVAMESV